MKSTLLALTLILSSSISLAGSKNVCDELLESGNSTPEQIKRCQDKFGVSEYAREKAAVKAAKDQADKAQSDKASVQKDNIEFKTFSRDELFEAGFGKPFYAVKVDYRYRPFPKEKRITSGEALCTYLGYEKSLKSVVSAEMMPQDADKKGLIIDTNFFGNISKEPELYRDEDLKFTVKRYVEITCARRKDKSIDDSSEVFKKLTEDLVTLAPEINNSPKETGGEINNGPRGKKDTKTPNGYNPPEWANDSKTISK